MTTFADLNLSAGLLRAIAEMGFEEPTPIQEKTIPAALAGRDIIGQAQTGTGKTASFAVPVIEKRPAGPKPYALILEPTRELAIQVAEEIGRLSKFASRSVLTVYGGSSLERQAKALHGGVDIVVGTPGRVLDHLKRRTLSLAGLAIVVLDEADEMLDMGFIEDIETILGMSPADRQMMLYSATMAPAIARIAKNHMRDPVKIAINLKEIVAPKIVQVFYEVAQRDKTEVLTRLLDVESPELTLVFCHTRREVDDVAASLRQLGYNAGALHGEFVQAQREEVMAKFKGGGIDILVATDVAGRGIDVENITHVINYSIPQSPEGYVHRIGRTGRAGRPGMAVTFVTPREYRQLQLIEKTARTRLSRRDVPSAGEVRKAREKQIAAEIAAVLEKGTHHAYRDVVREAAGAAAAEEVAAAALVLAFGDMKVAELEKRPAPGSGGGPGAPSVERGMTRLFVTLGRKDKVQTNEILRAIAGASDIPGKRVGKIDIHEQFTFVDVPVDIAEKVIAAMDNAFVKGKKIAVKKALPPMARPQGKGRRS